MAGKELPRTVSNPTGHHRFHKTPSLIPILWQIHPVHHLFNIIFTSFHLCLGLPAVPFPHIFSPILRMDLSSLPCTPQAPPISSSMISSSYQVAVQIVRVITTQFSTSLCSLLPRPTNSSLHPVL
jgi:hypothetical protein